jgi:hypothetical protein
MGSTGTDFTTFSELAVENIVYSLSSGEKQQQLVEITWLLAKENINNSQ